jgi:hypothetical protein
LLTFPGVSHLANEGAIQNNEGVNEGITINIEGVNEGTKKVLEKILSYIRKFLW